MKLFKSLILVFAIVLSTSCSSDDDSSSDVDTQPGELAAQVNGEGFISSEIATMANVQGGVLNITGVSEAEDRIAILINNFNNEGDFDLSGFTSVATAIYIPSGANVFFTTENEGGAGFVTISELNEAQETISGSFSFTAVRQTTDSSGEPMLEEVQVSAGSFSNISVTGL